MIPLLKVFHVHNSLYLFQVIFALPYFSGKYILGLAIDFDHNHLYWIVKDVQKTTLFRTDLLIEPDGNISEETVVTELNHAPRYVCSISIK